MLPEHECIALIDACSKRAPTGARNKALIAIMWRCGLRISEALALMPDDIDLQAHTLHVRHGKGDKSRVVGVDMSTSLLIEAWLAKRAKVRPRIPASAPLLCTLRGATVKTSYCRHLLVRLSTKAGVRRTHPHMLRHSYASELAAAGTPIDVIRDALGHSSVSTTDRYLRAVSPRMVIQATSQRTWPGEQPRLEPLPDPAPDDELALLQAEMTRLQERLVDALGRRAA